MSAAGPLPMSAATRPARFAMVAAAALLAAILVLLYAKTQRYDESGFFENVGLLRHLKQLDAQWELDVLKSRVGIHAHYDALADTLTELDTLSGMLQSQTARQSHDPAIELTTAETSLRGVVQEKAALVERFKSINAVLRNSLAFLPTAADDVQQRLAVPELLARTPAPAARVSANVNRLLLASLLYSQGASDDRGGDIRRMLAQLVADAPELPAEVRDRLDIFRAHVETVLSQQPAVDELLGQIAQVSTASRIDEIGNALSAEQQRAAAQNRQYRGYLLVFSTVLIGLLLYAAQRLVRSHAEINRINQALQAANETLEQRVLERTRELQQAQSDLVSTARRAGMAEIATNVLHNVGNVLNSVNVSADLITSHVRTSKVQGLAKAVHLMSQHAEDLGEFLASDTQGRMLPGYLEQLSGVLVTEQQGVIDELMALTRSVDHIKDIIATQQVHAGASSVAEPARIGDLVNDALRMSAASLARRQVEIERACVPVPELPLDKGRILQILVNLISNAGQAMEEVTDRRRRLSVRVEVPEGRTLRVEVADTGVGIAPENLTRVFAHGFTTRKDGHGFGLHSAAIAAREMGATLTARSEGPGRGACFTLELTIPASHAAHVTAPPLATAASETIQEIL